MEEVRPIWTNCLSSLMSISLVAPLLFPLKGRLLFLADILNCSLNPIFWKKDIHVVSWSKAGPWTSGMSTNRLSSPIFPKCPTILSSGQNLDLGLLESGLSTNCLSSSRCLLVQLPPLLLVNGHPNPTPPLPGPIGITQEQPSWFDFGRIVEKFPNSTNDLIRNIIVLHKYWTNGIFVVVCPSGIEIGLGPNWPFPGAVQCDLFSITPPSHSTEMTKEENDSKTLKFNRTL